MTNITGTAARSSNLALSTDRPTTEIKATLPNENPCKWRPSDKLVKHEMVPVAYIYIAYFNKFETV
jgi:hypothetical protein